MLAPAQADVLMDKRLVVVIDGWDEDSAYPQGHYVRTLGTIGDRDAETEVSCAFKRVMKENLRKKGCSIEARVHGLLDKPKRCTVLFAILQRGPGARLRFRLAWRVLCAVPSRKTASMPAASSM